MNGEEYISYKEVRDLKVERDVLEKLFLEKQQDCHIMASQYYFERKQRLLESMRSISDKDDKQNKADFKRLQKEYEKLCIQFGHDAPCPTSREEKVKCRCCGQEFSYEELIETYYKRTRFSRMILFDYVKEQPFLKNASLFSLTDDENEGGLP